MIVSKIGTTDIRNIGTGGIIHAVLPSYNSVKSVKSLVSRVKRLYPREDGMTYTINVMKNKKSIIIKVVKPELANRTYKKA